MTLDLTDLARRAVACQGWKWMPGMLFRENAVPGMGLWPEGAGRCGRPFSVDHVPYAATPDLSDPATLGCLLALVREARGNPTGFVVPERDGKWTYYTRLYDADYWTGGSEAEALVYALEKAP